MMSNMYLAVLPMVWSVVAAQTLSPSTNVPLRWMLAGIGGTVAILGKVHLEKRKEDARRIKYQVSRESFEARTVVALDRLEEEINKLKENREV